MKRLLPLLLLAACGPVPSDQPLSAEAVVYDAEGEETFGDLPVGEIEGADTSTKNWGAALTCKPIPEVSPLVQPRLILSIDGMSVHLIDEVTGYDRVFPAGVGKIESDSGE